MVLPEIQSPGSTSRTHSAGVAHAHEESSSVCATREGGTAHGRSAISMPEIRGADDHTATRVAPLILPASSSVPTRRPVSASESSSPASSTDPTTASASESSRPASSTDPTLVSVSESSRPASSTDPTPVSVSESSRATSSTDPTPVSVSESSKAASSTDPTSISVSESSRPTFSTDPTRPVYISDPTENQQGNSIGDEFKSLAESIGDIEIAAAECLNTCKSHNVSNPIEILKCAQNYIVQGRPLDVFSPSQPLDGETNFVSIDRFDVLNSAVEELKAVDNINLRLTLEISFYGEKARDAGGPRKEFFRLCLKEIKEKYFENGLCELLAEEYEYVGVIMALSMLQNGPIPRFMPEDILQEVFSETPPGPCTAALRRGFKKLGLYQIALNLHLMRPNEANQLSRRKLVLLLDPSFSEEGSNAHKYEHAVYAVFLKYV